LILPDAPNSQNGQREHIDESICLTFHMECFCSLTSGHGIPIPLIHFDNCHPNEACGREISLSLLSMHLFIHRIPDLLSMHRVPKVCWTPLNDAYSNEFVNL
jgi:hypothetical protein